MQGAADLRKDISGTDSLHISLICYHLPSLSSYRNRTGAQTTQAIGPSY